MNTMWGQTDDAANSVSWAARSLNLGSGKTAQAANNTALYNNVTPGGFKDGVAVGQFGVSTDEMANTDGESQRVAHAGWHLRRAGEGPITAFHVAAGADGGSGFSNGDTFVVSNGSVDATGIVIANDGAHMIGATVVDGGLFSNGSTIEVNFNREQHLTHLTPTGGTGYSNTDYVVVSNAIVNATATFTIDANGEPQVTTITNSGQFANDIANNELVVTVYAANGAISNADVFHLVSVSVTGGTGYNNTDYIVFGNGTVDGMATIATDGSGTFTNDDITLVDLGIWPDDFANTDVEITIYAANGAASNGESATVVANLDVTSASWAAEVDPSSGGAVTVTLGGRAGRVHYECLVAMGSMSNGSSDDTYLPET